MTTPTQNLLEWIENGIADIAMAQQTTNPEAMTDVNDRIEFKLLEQFRTRILQEVENEKAVIVNAFNEGASTVAEDEGDIYYNQTFNPNNDEQR